MALRKTVKIIMPDDATLRARQAVEDRRALATTVKTLAYERAERRFIFEMKSGAIVIVPVALIREFDRIEPNALSRAKIGPGRDVLELADADIHISVPGLFRDVFELNAGQRIGGNSRSKAKIAAARANGAAGGRPRRTKAL